MKSFWNNLQFLTLLVLVCLITYASHPDVLSLSHDAGMVSGTFLSKRIIYTFVLLFLMCVNVRSWLMSKTIVAYFVLCVMVFIGVLITDALFNSHTMLNDLRYIGMCLMAVMIGWQMNVSEKKLRWVVFVYAAMLSYVTYMQVQLNIGGLVIEDEYFTENKNSLGAMVATGSFSLLFVFLNMRGHYFRKMFSILLFFVMLVLLLTIRARAATLTVVVVTLFFLIQRYRRHGLSLLLFSGALALTALFIVYPAAIDYVVNSFVQNYEGGDITSGRMERNVAGLNFLADHFWLGELTADGELAWIHNYPLNKLCEFGLVFSIPILIIYVMLLALVIGQTFKQSACNPYNVGYFALLVPFMISMAEPTYPFSPGTATAFNFILFGMSMRNTYSDLHDVATIG